MSLPQAETREESYFVAQLAAEAKRQDVAAPATIDSLIANLTYLSDEEISLVRDAHTYASQAHQGQHRRTGHDYITHPTAVAQILANMNMDHQSLMAALLHDVIEDSETSRAYLGEIFGSSVADIVDGVSKLSKIFASRDEAQAENFQKMAMAMAKDIRVIMVKMADRLHNMRTIGVMSDAQRKRIARETLDFYAPIANRLGVQMIKSELEELAFRALYPLRSDRIARAVTAARGNRKAMVDEVQTTIATALNREGIVADVIGRQKNIFSIYRKMKTQHKSFAEIMDVFGFRIIVDQPDACYRALGVVHGLYSPLAARFKDYIAIPKVNGYQSLHTSLMGPHGAPIEVQIRTKQQQAVAENGIAGHWLYRSNSEFETSQQRARQWVSDLMELQSRAGNPMEFIESLKIDLFPDEVYVFTPKGKILELPRGASPVDFAYCVHTDIGNSCMSCRVDGQLAPLSQQLQSGQKVEIITAPDSKPNPAWLNFAVTSKARSAIRSELKQQQGSQSIALGRKLLNRVLGAANTSINDLDFRRLRRVFSELGVRKLNELLESIGNGDVSAHLAAQKLLSAENPDYQAIAVEGAGPVTIAGGEGLVVSYGRCCGPLPGDHIVGHMTPGKGFVVHVETCNNLNEVRRRTPHEITPARWTSDVDDEFQTVLRVNVRRRKGIMAEVAAEITSCDAGVESINVEERNAEISTVNVGITVRNRDHLAKLMRRLRRITAVINVARRVS
ncbi:MAG: bifunctional (p)ppGpp synthetase/guanosine-3',5'-bis(diphosphate) 3'-pyrophosphohydrolase [Pseudomonadales bacterium]|jgi:guanosine-3',5'-bis(diphosphate) 3'-pyrophosphohydrolase|nr:bifunctional (p)ppGpp synthetase/guanosine-3',5'-bis(diphosphate) 3'-pyrophosphohydrolase [Pseudomonadales bacterium]|tara:strand:+ start:497 stop:2695 length:2199 start_codon:yes stop_codon:yes gene_type:complete